MSAARKARDRALAAEADAVDAAARAQAVALKAASKASKARIASRPDVLPADAVARRLSPAAARRAFMVAQSPTARPDPEGPINPALALEAAQILAQLRNDQQTLKALQSTERKVAAKADMIPAYLAWCRGVIAGGEGVRTDADEIFSTLMVWLIDVGDYAEALPMAEHLLRFNLPMPPRIDRTAGCFIAEEIADAAIRAFRAGGDAAAAFPAGILASIDDLVEDEDMPDQVRAKLKKAIGMGVMAGADDADATDLKNRQETTLRLYLRALELHDSVGVKKEVEQLQRDLNKSTVPGRLNQPAPGDPNSSDQAPA